MNRVASFRILCAGLIVVALLLGNPLHALVPHEHGEDHEHHGESVVWQSLHSSLRHEDKKALPPFNTLAIVGFVFLIQHAISPAQRLRYVDSITNALRRGIVPHRKFG